MITGNLFVISGPSGTGKSTIVHNILTSRNDTTFSVSATTRGPRKNEINGVDYFFITQEQFDSMIVNKEFLEHATYVSNSYGTPRKPVVDNLNCGKNVILDIEVQGASQIKENYPQAIFIYITPPSMEQLETRLRARATDSEEKILNRLNQVKNELKYLDIYDYIVINDKLDVAIKEVSAIIESQNLNNSIRNKYIMEAYLLWWYIHLWVI